MGKLSFGIAVTLICMSIVFLVLVGLSFIIRLEKSVINKNNTKQNGNENDADNSLGSSIEEKPEEENEEIIAVISAALAAVLGRPASNIVVRSIKRIDTNAPSWAFAGRQEQMNARF